MAFSFNTRIKIAPGIRINLGKRGASLSAGPRGASITVGQKGVYANVGLPGTGLSVRRRVIASPEQTSSRMFDDAMTDGGKSFGSRVIRWLQLSSLWLTTTFVALTAIVYQTQNPTSYAFVSFLLATMLLAPPIRAAISEHFRLSAGRTSFALILAVVFASITMGHDLQLRENAAAITSDRSSKDTHSVDRWHETTIVRPSRY